MYGRRVKKLRLCGILFRQSGDFQTQNQTSVLRKTYSIQATQVGIGRSEISHHLNIDFVCRILVPRSHLRNIGSHARRFGRVVFQKSIFEARAAKLIELFFVHIRHIAVATLAVKAHNPRQKIQIFPFCLNQNRSLSPFGQEQTYFFFFCVVCKSNPMTQKDN